MLFDGTAAWEESRRRPFGTNGPWSEHLGSHDSAFYTLYQRDGLP